MNGIMITLIIVFILDIISSIFSVRREVETEEKIDFLADYILDPFSESNARKKPYSSPKIEIYEQTVSSDDERIEVKP